MALKFLSLALTLGFAEIAIAASEEIKVPSPATVKAYTQYWDAFDAYEKKVIATGNDKFQKSWLQIQELRKKHEFEYNQKQLDQLENAAYEYEEHIKTNEFADNIPYVYLNLAQVQNQIGTVKDLMGEDGTLYRQKALEVLAKIDKSFPNFSQKEASIYLRALVLSSMGRDVDAAKVWRELAALAKNSIYGVHAKIAVGDAEFKKEQSVAALKTYESALTLLSSVATEDTDYERLRIQYRIVWASYRSNELEKTIDTAVEILSPGRHERQSDIRAKIEEDATQLLGDALYENNNIGFTKGVLKRQVLNEWASRVSVRILKNYLANRLFEDIVEIGEYTLDLYPVSEVAPDIILIVADAYKEVGRDDQRIKTLEKLALFLPKESLWRARHKDQFELVQAMEQKAKSSALAASEYYYERGMSTGNPQYFESASSFFTVLLDLEPNGPDSSAYRLKRGHCYYFTGRLDQASSQYKELIAELRVDTATLKVAANQEILTREKIWRESYSKIAQTADPNTHPLVVENLRKLEEAVENFANRFPPKMDSRDSELAIDSLLIAASANRDHENFKEASKYWNRILLSNPTIGQRAVAIRGLVHAKVKAGTPMGIVETTRRYLRLENWDKLGATLGNELRGILSQAILTQAKEYNSQGKYSEAGALMESVAQEFKNIPNRARIYRDGAYYLAMAGQWADAESFANAFIGERVHPYLADMTYLKARAEEFQMRFGDAAKDYFAHARANPSHPKAMVAMERAENLARGESNWPLAANAAIGYAAYLKERPQKLALYKRALDSYNNAEDYQKALEVAQKRYELADSINDKILARLDLAVCHMRVRNEDHALDEFQKIAKIAATEQIKLNSAVFAEVYGAANFYLGEESRAQLNDFRVVERGSNIRASVNQKMRIYEAMMNYYSMAAKSNHPEWTSQARFVMGLESDRFSDELQAVIKLKNTNDNLTAYLNSNTEKLRSIAKNQYSANLLAMSRSPREYQNNTWVKKSTLKLNGYLKAKENFKSVEYGPNSLSLNIPQQWSP